jgi:hypothetical protein
MSLRSRLLQLADQVTERAGDALRTRTGRALAPAGLPREMTLQASLPNPFGDTPLCSISLQLTTEDHAEGETFRLRAHVQTQLVVPPAQRAALPGPREAPPDDRRALLPRGRRAARSLMQRGLQTSIAQRVTPYLERRFETWVDLQASTRPLDQGAQALVPEHLQSLGLGRVPVLRTRGEPQVENWMGRCEGERPGVAQVTLLQFNEAPEAGMSPRKKRRKPVHVAASVATFYEDKAGQ